MLAYLYYREGIKVNKKRIYRLMKENDLLVNKRIYKAKRKPTRPKPKASYPNQILGTDMTKIEIGIWGWHYLVIVMDWFTNEIIGYHLSLQSKSKDWQESLGEAATKRFPRGIKGILEKILFFGP